MWVGESRGKVTYTLTIRNIDPTADSDRIARFDIDSSSGQATLKVGHTWMSIETPDGNIKHRGWGTEDDSTSGKSVPGQVLKTRGKNLAGREITEEFSIPITKEQYGSIIEYWDSLKKAGTDYNYAGREADPNALNCTQALIEALLYAGILNSEQEEILTRDYEPWRDVLPEVIPEHFKDLGDLIGRDNPRTPNPNEFGGRLQELDTLRPLRDP